MVAMSCTLLPQAELQPLTTWVVLQPTKSDIGWVFTTSSREDAAALEMESPTPLLKPLSLRVAQRVRTVAAVEELTRFTTTWTIPMSKLSQDGFPKFGPFESTWNEILT